MEAKQLQVAPDLYVRVLPLSELHEQAVNAQVMTQRDFDRLVQNIRKRGALESMPYCSRPQDVGKVWIVSGHHRIRAARVAGLKEVPVLVDTSPQTRSEVVARQIAHNTLVGRQDEGVLRQLLGEVKTADDLLATGLDESLLPAIGDASPLSTPQGAVEWKMVTLAFLPGQMADFKALIEALEGRQELVGAAPIECYDAFASAMGGCARVTATRSVATVVATLTAMALAEIEAATDPEAADA